MRDLLTRQGPAAANGAAIRRGSSGRESEYGWTGALLPVSESSVTDMRQLAACDQSQAFAAPPFLGHTRWPVDAFTREVAVAPRVDEPMTGEARPHGHQLRLPQHPSADPVRTGDLQLRAGRASHRRTAPRAASSGSPRPATTSGPAPDVVHTWRGDHRRRLAGRGRRAQRATTSPSCSTSTASIPARTARTCCRCCAG